MTPDIYRIVTGDATVASLISTRFYPFGEAPQGVAKPYAVWQLIFGEPLNCISGRPDMDQYSVQVDVYAAQAGEARQAAEAIRDAIELESHITGWRGESRDPETNNYRVSFDCDWFVARDTASI